MTAHTSRPSIRSPGARTPTSSGWPSVRCRASRATCCGTPRSRADRTPTSPGRVGSTTQAIGARASRARVALGGAYLAGHLDLAFDQPPSTPQCSEVRAQLVDLVRGGRERPEATGAGSAPRPVRAVPDGSRPPRTIQRAVAHGATARPGRRRWIGRPCSPAWLRSSPVPSPPPRLPSRRSWLRRAGRRAGGSSMTNRRRWRPRRPQVARRRAGRDDHAASRDGRDRSAAARLGGGRRPDRRARRSRRRPLRPPSPSRAPRRAPRRSSPSRQ